MDSRAGLEIFESLVAPEFPRINNIAFNPAVRTDFSNRRTEKTISMKKLLARIRAILRNRQFRKLWTRIVSSIACLVVFVTTYALVLPAITMENEALCGIEAHQHNKSCYEERLICNIPESDGHIHTEDCYSTIQKLICDRSEHLHNSDCYDENGNLTCSLEEHQHGEECFEEIRELICGFEEEEGHSHDSSCYKKVLTCGKEVHTHSQACYREDAASVAETGSAAVEAATSSSAVDNTTVDDAGFDGESNAFGTMAPAETASEGYVPALDTLDFQQLLNNNTTIYYHRAGDSTEKENSGQTTDWHKVDEDTILGENDILRVYLAYTIPAGSLNETNETTRYHLPDNLHLTDKQIDDINQMENGLSSLYMDYETLQVTDPEKHSRYLGAEAIDGHRTPDQTVDEYLPDKSNEDNGEQAAQETISAVVKAEHVYEEDPYGKKDANPGTDLVFTFSPSTLLKNRNEYDSEGKPVKTGEGVSGWFALDINMDQVEWDNNSAEIIFASENEKPDTSLSGVKLQKADSTLEKTDSEYEGKTDSRNSDVEKDTDSSSSAEENNADVTAETHPAVSFEDSLTVRTGSLGSDTDAASIPESSKLTVSVSAEAGTFPAGTTMALSAVTDMDSVAEAVEGTVNGKTCGFQAVDISFRDKDGNEIEPLKPISVTMRSDSIKAATEDSSIAPVVVHIEDRDKETAEADESPATTVIETLPNSVETKEKSNIPDTSYSSEEISFESEAFSVYAIVYTVDFYYEVNGEIFSFILQGGDTVSLRELVDELHIMDSLSSTKSGNGIKKEVDSSNTLRETVPPNTVTVDSFMENIESVTFSNSEYLVPVKVEEEMTAGQLKTRNHLFPTYPLGLKQEEVLALNSKILHAGDWALVSMKAFDSEESLSIVLKTGETIVVTVLDAQDAPMIGDRVQTISNPAGTTIDLFDYWVVSQDLVGRDGWGDLDQGRGSNEAGDDKPLNGTGNNKGINSSVDDASHGHALKFTPAWEGTVYNGQKTGTTGEAWHSVNLNHRDGLNSYTGGIAPFPGIVQSTLTDGYPVLTENAAIGSTGESLAYLFDPSITHSGKTSYPGVNQLLYVDKDGYYTYDSRDYKADYNDSDQTFTLTGQTSNNSEIRGFWPFGTQNFWVGMHVNTQFSMPRGGQVLNPSNELKDMQFEFSGDDDTWIYVDGVLIGDGGGIHNRTEIDINFKTGNVIINGENIGTIRSIVEEAKSTEIAAFDAEQRAKWDAQWNGETFAENTYHTFDMFYLERGGGESNLYIHYNLVSTADFTAHKSFHGTNEEDRLRRNQFQFELTGLDGKFREVPVENTDTFILVEEDSTSRAIMPQTAASTGGQGTVESPCYDPNTVTTVNGQDVPSQTYITGVTEDGNINFGTAEISSDDMNEADQGNPPVYRYIIREVVPDDAVNAGGITWESATEDQRAAGGFVKDDIVYDGTVYYMAGRVTSWTETNAAGQQVIRHGLAKTYYTDDTFTTVRENTPFISFVNSYNASHGNVSFTKKDQNGDPLEGAEFALFKDSTCRTPARMIDVDNRPWVAISNEDGTVSFENVRTGTYYMKETVAPEGFALDETVYEVVIEDANDPAKSSRIIINGDETETGITEIVNTEHGKLSIIKKWLNASGNEVNGGEHQAKVRLYRKTDDSVVPEPSSVTVVYHREGASWNLDTGNGNQVSVEGASSFDLTWHLGDNASHQLSNMVVNGVSYPDAEGREIDTGAGKIRWIAWNGSTSIMTVSDIKGDMYIEFTSNCDWFSEKPSVNNKVDFVPPTIDTTPVRVGEISLTPDQSWTAVKTIGGTLDTYESEGYDLPATDNDGFRYLYYIVELNEVGQEIAPGDSPMVGYTLDSYSANNHTGVADQGVILVYNKSDVSLSTEIDIRKVDIADLEDAQPKLLKGAAFTLTRYTDNEFRAVDTSWGTDGSGTVSLQDEKKEDGTYSLNGLFIFTDIPEGYYMLTETQYPEGYISVSENPVFQVKPAGDGSSLEIIQLVKDEGSGTYMPGKAGWIRIENGTTNIYVGNTPGAALPHTGGPGTRLFTILGSFLILGAGALLWRKRRFI